MPSNKRRSVLFSSILAVVAALGYGYWHHATHGSLYVWVLDVTDHQRYQSLADGELTLLDVSGAVLAKVAATHPAGAFLISHPEAYSCRDVEALAPFSPEARVEWDRCFERQSRWLVTWIRRVRYADVNAGVCRLHRLPVSASEHADEWWLWWVPLPHIGGKPYTRFRIDVTFDRARCDG